MRKTILFLLYITFILYWTGAVYSNSFRTDEWTEGTRGVLLSIWVPLMIAGALWTMIPKEQEHHEDH